MITRQSQPVQSGHLQTTNLHVFSRVHLAILKPKFLEQGFEVDLNREFAWFELHDTIRYVSFADDFGPMNLASIFRFCDILDAQLASTTKPVALFTKRKARIITNAVFLLGSYMIVRLKETVSKVERAMHPVVRWLVPYRDVSSGAPTFGLDVWHCWRGLARAQHLGWLGGFNLDEYEELDNPLNADLHVVVPGKFIAMRGPQTTESSTRWEDRLRADGTFSHRIFSPAHYADILQQFGVRAVARLNEPRYARDAFAAAGIAVAELCFEDCTPPPIHIVAKFLALAEAIPGPIAVHCKAGLGRTGTLIALYTMKHHAFTALEAMGWLRIVRPGSVIGEQQAFLCAREPAMRRSAVPLQLVVTGELADAMAGGDAAALQRAVDELVAAYDARFAAAVQRVCFAAGNVDSESGFACQVRRPLGKGDHADGQPAGALSAHVWRAARQRGRLLSLPP